MFDYERNAVVDLVVVDMAGANAAILYRKISGWISRHQNENINFYDGRHWVYNTKEQWHNQIPCFTYKQIRTALDKLINSGLIVTGNYNKENYDKTLWYSVNPVPEEKIKALAQKGQGSRPKRANEMAQKGQPIPKAITTKAISKDIVDSFESAWQAINPKLPRSRRRNKEKARDRFQKKSGEYGCERLVQALRCYYHDKQDENYKYASGMAVILNGDGLEAYLDTTLQEIDNERISKSTGPSGSRRSPGNKQKSDGFFGVVERRAKARQEQENHGVQIDGHAKRREGKGQLSLGVDRSE